MRNFRDGKLSHIQFILGKIVPTLLPNSVMKKRIIDPPLEARSINLSNVTASRNPWVFDGKQTHWMAGGSNGPCPTMTVISLGHMTKITMSTQRNVFNGCKELIKLVEDYMVD